MTTPTLGMHILVAEIVATELATEISSVVAIISCHDDSTLDSLADIILNDNYDQRKGSCGDQ